jgi:hypothetical protein
VSAGFVRVGELIEREFSVEEVDVLTSLAEGLDETLSDDSSDDPVLDRLLPAAYGDDDPEASDEFARFTRDRITEAKRGRLTRVLLLSAQSDEASEVGGAQVSLDDAAAQDWLLALNDIRLALAARIGVERLDDVRIGPIGEVYEWLGWLQSGLVDIVDS